MTPHTELFDFTGQGTILLAEDEEGVRALFARGLRMRGFSVLEVANGLEALKVLEQPKTSVDLLVSDVVMPEMDGPTLLKAMRERRPDLKVLFISGYAFEKSLPELEAPAFLPKPFSLAQLVAAVKETMLRPEGSATARTQRSSDDYRAQPTPPPMG
jgi:two-component system cell cycle sensor histidine kinase/response regulator CckA